MLTSIRNVQPPLLELRSVSVSYGGITPTVKEASLTLDAGECLGIVGRSGCGKSTLARAIVGLEKVCGGQILWQGRDIATFGSKDRLDYLHSVQMVFQDTLGTLNPRMTIGATICEVLKVHCKTTLPTRMARREKAAALLESVGLQSDTLDKYPHEMSGGQRQRVGIARALAVEPRVIIADEPVSALDVAIQAQLLHTMHDLLRGSKMSMLFISHDLAVVRCMCKRAIIMEKGEIVESGFTDQIFTNPQAPFTRQLLDAVPRI